MSMAKKMISRLSVLTVLIVFLAACSKTVEYTNIIPADATVVTSINLKSLASKAGLNDKDDEAGDYLSYNYAGNCNGGILSKRRTSGTSDSSAGCSIGRLWIMLVYFTGKRKSLRNENEK